MKYLLFSALLLMSQLATAQHISNSIEEPAIGVVAAMATLPMPTLWTAENPPITKPWFPWSVICGKTELESIVVWGIPAQYGEGYYRTTFKPLPQNGLIKGYLTKASYWVNENTHLEPFTF